MKDIHTYRYAIVLDFIKNYNNRLTYRIQFIVYDNNEPQPTFIDLHRNATFAELRTTIRQFRNNADDVKVRVRTTDMFGKPILKRGEMFFLLKEM